MEIGVSPDSWSARTTAMSLGIGRDHVEFGSAAIAYGHHGAHRRVRTAADGGHDVVVGHDEPVRAEDDARTQYGLVAVNDLQCYDAGQHFRGDLLDEATGEVGSGPRDSVAGGEQWFYDTGRMNEHNEGNRGHRGHHRQSEITQNQQRSPR